MLEGLDMHDKFGVILQSELLVLE